MEKNISQVMISMLYNVCKKHKIIKIVNQIRENRKYYCKCSNDFAIDCRNHHKVCFSRLQHIICITIPSLSNWNVITLIRA